MRDMAIGGPASFTGLAKCESRHLNCSGACFKAATAPARGRAKESTPRGDQTRDRLVDCGRSLVTARARRVLLVNLSSGPVRISFDYFAALNHSGMAIFETPMLENPRIHSVRQNFPRLGTYAKLGPLSNVILDFRRRKNPGIHTESNQYIQIICLNGLLIE